MRILCIEDDDILARFTELGLKPMGFAVDRVATAEDGIEALATTPYDAVVLDLNLPDADGIAVLKRLRAGKNAVPVLILSARAKTDERVAGLHAGADDYLTKPYDITELAARLRALARRPAQLLGTELTCGNLSLTPADLTATVEGRPVTLSRREASVLEQFMRNIGRPVAKSSIEDRLYSFGEEVSSNSIEVHVHNLRKRLSAAGANVKIETRRGSGYILVPPDTAAGASHA